VPFSVIVVPAVVCLPLNRAPMLAPVFGLIIC
jgi:hypothetical protein